MNLHSRHNNRAAACRLLLAASVFAAVRMGVAQESDPDARAGLSRTMRLGVHFYEKRDDVQAMDRFLEVLMKGDPSERPMANEYINLITHRMNTGDRLPMSPRPNPPVTASRAARAAAPAPAAKPASAAAANRGAPTAPESNDVQVEPMPDARPVEETARPREASVEPPKGVSKANRSLMAKEIRARLRHLRDAGLEKIREFEGVRVLKLDTGDPQAIAIPSALLFQSQTSFKKTALPLLDALSSLAYSLSGAQIVILPEGTALGDAKVPDMRRTMGLSAHLLSGDIAPSRVRVNLLNTQVDIPRSLQEFRGILILFLYNQSLNLVVESAIGDEKGPPISLGVHPRGFSTDKPEGAIIEFSVQDPPEGLVSWEFKLLAPTADGEEMAPLQEVVGGGPVYHQIYWNGRQGYFGQALSPGRYECVLTATDAKNRQRTLHRWIQLLPSRDDAQTTMASTRVLSEPDSELNNAPAARAPAADLGAGAKSSEPLLRAAPKSAPPKGRVRTKRGKRKLPGAKAVPDGAGDARPPASTASSAAAAEGATEGGSAPGHEKPSAVPYEIVFLKDKHELTPEAEQTLSRLSETLSYYPLENLEITGYSQSSEVGAAALAQKRGQVVAGLLINKYKIDTKKISVHSSIADGEPKVEIRFTGNE